MGLLSAALGILDEAGEYVRARVGVPFVIQFGPGFAVTAAQNGGIDVMTVLPDTAAGGGLTDVTGTPPVLVTTPTPGVRDVAVGAATASNAGTMSAADKAYHDSIRPSNSAFVALPDSSAALLVGFGRLRRLLAATLTVNRNPTLGVTGAVEGDEIVFDRVDVTAYTYAIINGGPGAGTLYTFPAFEQGDLVVRFNGANWEVPTRAFGLRHLPATTSRDGLMSKQDKSYLSTTVPNFIALVAPFLSYANGPNYVPRAFETVLVDASAGDSITLPLASATIGPITVVGMFSGTGGTVTRSGLDTIIGLTTNTVAAGQIKIYYPEGPLDRWAVVAGVS